MDDSISKNGDGGGPSLPQARSKRVKIDPDSAQKPDSLKLVHTVSSKDELTIEKLASEVENLMLCIKKGQNFLRLASAELPDDHEWQQLRSDFEPILERNVDTSCKVVVLGASGVGKSSVLNALLDEYNLLPSSDVGEACTAVPIEIHYNATPGASNTKAEFYYITEEVWRKTISQAKAELDGIDDDNADQSQSALGGLQAVYPLLSRDYIATADVDRIVASNDSRLLLNKCITLEAGDHANFHKIFWQEVGSLKRPGFATWPLVDHVRLYVRHPLLEHGLVLVDIPGMFDRNRARVEKAEDYLSRCSAVCVVAPAARCGSDFHQESLLGRALLRIQYDGRLDNVMLICSKSDDVQLRQAVLQLDTPEIKHASALLTEAEQKKKSLEDEIAVREAERREQLTIAKWRQIDIGRWKNAIKAVESQWDQFVQPKERLPNGSLLKVEGDGRVWDAASVSKEIQKLEEEKTTARTLIKEVAELIARENVKLSDVQIGIQSLELNLARITFRLRNDYLRDAQARMYRKSIEDFERLSSQAAEDMVAEPSKMSDVVDLEDIEKRVFCVSALAYCCLAGITANEPTTDAQKGFKLCTKGATEVVSNIDDTEIPALSKRLVRVALLQRRHELQKTDLKLQIVLGSLKGRLSQNVQTQKVDPQRATQATEDFSGNISRFTDAFQQFLSTTTAFEELQRGFGNQIPSLSKKVLKKAGSRLQPLAEHPSTGRNSRGLWPQEYKAAMHPARTGYYVGKRIMNDGEVLWVDFNDRVAAVIRQFTSKIVKATLLSKRSSVKQALAKSRRVLELALDQLHTEFRLQSITAGVSPRRVCLADQQVLLRRRDLARTFEDAFLLIHQVHGDASGRISKDVEEKWTDGYARAYQQRGLGARVRMSEELTKALDTDSVIFDSLRLFCDRIKAGADEVLQDLDKELMDMAKSIADEYRAYMQDRIEKVRSVGDDQLDKIRNRMIALEYEDMEVELVAPDL